MNPNTDRDERAERMLQALVETAAGERLRIKYGTADLLSVITHVLFPLDSQAAGDTSNLLRRLKDFLFDNCNHVGRDHNYDWCPSCVMTFMEVVAKPSDSDAATRMRGRCVGKVREMRDQWQEEGGHFWGSYVGAANKIISALESTPND